MKVSRLLKSRELWKQTALVRRKKLVSLARKLAKAEAKIEKLKWANEDLQAKNEKLLSSSTPIVLTQTPLIKAEIRILCIFMFSWGLISCNAISRVLWVLRQFAKLPLIWVPNPSSVVNWVARVGLGMLMLVKPIPTPWVAIIDSSISYGKAKMFVCLRVPINHFLKHGSAVSLAHVECIGLKIKDSWQGQDVCDALLEFFKQAGNPVAIVKDQGADLKCGVTLLQDKFPEIQTIRDIGHVAALLLKKSYEKNKLFVKFLKLIDVARARLCHSDAACLRPPKIRAKGRFQSISRLVDWANKIILVIEGGGRAKPGSLKERLQNAIPGLCSLRFFFTRFARDCNTVNEVLGILKTQGLNQETYKLCKDKIMLLPHRSRVSRKLLAWLNETIRVHCLLSIGQTPLLVSSDVIESLFGVVKSILERTPSPEFGTLSLATPLLCGAKDEKSFAQALESCPQKTLINWKMANLQNTNRRTRKALLQKSAKIRVPNMRSASGP
jgi:hypothetical protein